MLVVGEKILVFVVLIPMTHCFPTEAVGSHLSFGFPDSRCYRYCFSAIPSIRK